MIKTIKHFQDPGHGWYKVSRKLLRKMNLLDKISSFSYQKGNWVYLEEDVDASIFFTRYKELFGELQIKVTTNISENMSSIRYYQPFQMGMGSGIPKPV